MTGSGGGVIRGEVVDERGRPVPDARILVLAAPAPHPDTALLASADGRFTLGAPLPGRYELAVHADGHPAATVAVEVGAGQQAVVRVRLG